MARMRDSKCWYLLARAARYRLHNMIDVAQLSRRQLERRLQEELGRSPEEWLNEQRMVAARHLLHSQMTVKEVAFELGYLDSAHFCNHFKRTYQITPSEFARKTAPHVALTQSMSL